MVDFVLRHDGVYGDAVRADRVSEKIAAAHELSNQLGRIRHDESARPRGAHNEIALPLFRERQFRGGACELLLHQSGLHEIDQIHGSEAVLKDMQRGPFHVRLGFGLRVFEPKQRLTGLDLTTGLGEDLGDGALRLGANDIARRHPDHALDHRRIGCGENE
jgi:hypothetical protein